MMSRAAAERVLTWVLAVALVASVVAIGVIAVNPPETTDPYTEFYLLGPDGEAAGYPTELSVGESGTVLVGITNHEHRDVEYTLRVTWNGTVTEERSVRVADEETWEEPVEVTAPAEPGRYQVRFELYRGGLGEEAYRYGQLWVWVER